MVNHLGTFGGGHYTSLVRNHTDARWYSFDDSHVEAVDPSKVQSRHGYILFYIREDMIGKSLVADGVYPCRKPTEEELAARTKSSWQQQWDNCVVQ